MKTAKRQIVITVALSLISLLSAWNSAIAANQVRVAAMPGSGEPAVAKVDAHGSIHLLMNSADGPKYARSDNDGATFTQPMSVITGTPQPEGLTYAVWDMAIGVDGRIHVVLETNAWKLKLPKEEWACFYTRLDPGATAFTAVKNINHRQSEGFSIAADERGNVAACWLAGKLFASVSHNNGQSFAEAVEMDPASDPCDCCTTSCTFDKDGQLAVLFREETNNQRDIFLLRWDTAGHVVSKTRVSKTPWQIDGCPMTYFQLSRVPAGFSAIWPTKQRIYWTQLNDEGVVQPPGEIKTSMKTGTRTGILALSSPDGHLLAVSKRKQELEWQLFDREGRAVGEVETAPSAGSGVAGVVDRHGDFVLLP